MTKLTSQEKRELIERVRELIFSARTQAEFDQLRHVFEGATASDIHARISSAEGILAGPPRRQRESGFRTTIRLLHAKGLEPHEIAYELRTTANNVRVTMCLMRRQGSLARALKTADPEARLS